MTEFPERCGLCGTDLEEQAANRETAAGGSEGVYCSPGCRRVATALGSAVGTAEAQESRGAEHSDGEGTQEPAGGEGAATVDGPPAPGSEPESGETTERVFLHVDGMHSATCETFLEATAEKQEGVASAAASYVTETIRIEYDPERVSREELSTALTTVGYKVTPRAELATVAAERERRPDQRQLDDLLGFRYAAGVLVAVFMLFPYAVVLYPAQAAEVFGFGTIGFFGGGPGPGDAILVLPLFLTMTSVVLFFTGLPLLRGAYVSLLVRRPNTDLLVAITIVGAYLYGTVAFLSGDLRVYYDLTIVVAAVVVAAIFYESLVKQRAVDLLTDLTVSQVDSARVLGPDGETTETAVSELEPGDRILVREGERVPVDGELEAGDCTVDEAVVTGESLPVRKARGSELVGGSVVTDGAATVRVGDPPTSGIAGITTTVWDLQSGTHGIQRRSDRIAARIVPGIFAVAVLAGGLGYVTGGVIAGVLAFLGAVLVACPWSVGLSTPLSVARSIEAATRRGVVVFDETVFERLRETDTVVFDKTGTLTTGEMEVLDADCPPALLAAAGELEKRAAHPAGEAIAAAADRALADGGTEPDEGSTTTAQAGTRVEDVTTHSTGIEGVVDGEHLLIGNLALFSETGWSVDTDIESRATDHREAGDLPVVVGRNGRAEGLIILGDDARPEWEATVQALADRDVRTVVLTGDDEAPAATFAEHPGVDHVFAGVSPAGKTATIRLLQERGHVTMVGDGTNDGPALAAADLGVSLGSGTALASEAADLAILDDDLTGLETAFELASAARRRLLENTVLGLSYNVVVVPLAIVGLLNPLFAMGATVLSASLVGANAVRPLID
jgi:heavy metal translocating P-type ATPase